MNKDAVAEMSQQYQVEAAEKLVPEGYKQTEVGVTNSSGTNLNATCGGPQGGGMDSRRIPEGWKVESFGELFSIIDGDRGANYPSSSDFNDYGYCLFLSASNVTKTGFKFDNILFIDEGRDRLLSKGKLVRNDIVLTTRGTVGNFAYYNHSVPYLNLRINSGMVIIRNDGNQVTNNFAYAVFRSNIITQQIEKLTFGSAQPQLTVSGIRSFLIYYPESQKEQTAIARALSDTDALLSELEKLIAKKQAIKTATMQQLLTGRTRLPQFANHPDGSKKGYKQSELGEIPEDWKVGTYGEIFNFLTTSTNSRSDLSIHAEYGYIHYGDIHTLWNNFLDLNKTNTPKIDPLLVRSAFVQDGDLVMADASEDYEGIGKSIEIKNIGNKSIVAGLHTYLLRDSYSFFVDGFRGYLHQVPAVKSMIDKLATGMKVYGISKRNLEGIYLPIPSKKEQTAIATILSDMDEEIQALEHRLNKTRQIKQGMMQELLTGKTRLIVGGKNV
ncbi:restriction endonuclease subunit S [uncultured Psychrobacter sp.]|uniref:restriction endonuclease subunit S n=1 Tax=uncultured Psychrobacter sp. TaxID=259303 RepID=UPI002598BB58|nr:restriction endonuclease subunit S [uncultured Psychrobacter sp.]